MDDFITLIIGSQTIKAERALLVENSRYFEAMFSGNFMETTANETDLSMGIDNFKVLETVVKYMRTKKIGQMKKNLRQIIQVATFLMMDQLLDDCVKFMKESMCVNTWLQYHMYATEFGIREMKLRTEACIASRFHDLLIFEEGTLHIFPEQLQYLYENGFMKYCSVLSLTQFLLKWLLTNDGTEDEATDTSKVEVSVKIIEAMVVEVKSSEQLRDEEIDEAVEYFEKVRAKLDGLSDAELKQKFVNNVETKLKCIKDFKQTSERGKKPVTESEQTVAVFTLSKRVLPKMFCERSKTQIKECYDFLAYDSSSKIWYQLTDLDLFTDKDLESVEFESHLKRGFNWSDKSSWLKIIFEYDDFTFVANEDFLVINLESIDFIDMLIFGLKDKHKCWRGFSVNNVLDDGTCHAYAFVAGDDGKIFIVGCVSDKYSFDSEDSDVEDDADMLKLSFRLFMLDITRSHVRKMTSIAPVLVVKADEFYEDTKLLNLCHSKKKNMLLLTFNAESGYIDAVITIDLSVLKEVDCSLLEENISIVPELVWFKQGKDETMLFQENRILELEDRILILKKTKEESLIPCLQYYFDTKTVTEVTEGVAYKLSMLAEEDANIRKDRVKDKKLSVCHKNSFWQVEQRLQYGNVFKEVRFTDANEFVTVEHKPPPFVELKAVYAKCVDSGMFSGLKPVERYLVPGEEESDCEGSSNAGLDILSIFGKALLGV